MKQQDTWAKIIMNSSIENILWAGSLLANSILVLLALWGLFAFFPKKGLREDTASGWLILAIWLGFLGVGLNVLYWKVIAEIVIVFDLFSVEQVRFFGNNIGDFIWKTMSMVSIYLHFYARWKAIPAEEQKHWRPLLMGFYPNTKALAVQFFHKMKGIRPPDDRGIG